MKIDASGNRIWQKLIGSEEAARFYEVIIDLDGNIYIVGQTYDNADWDGFLAKYKADGERLWFKQFGSGEHPFGTDKAYGITTNQSGKIHITGYTTGSLDNQLKDNPDRDVFILVFDSDGNQQ